MKTRLHIAYPMVFVTDFAKAVAYYKTKLRFKVDYLYGEPPFYGMITRDGASFHLRHVDKQPMDRSEEDLLTAVILVEGIKSLFLEFKANGTEFHQTLKLQPWGTSDFIVKDPDGNLLSFASAKK
ncbi:MAG: VOC family protein [Methylacidiphilales bacterium]|nr:VOC family protein [Candidatus Methylacidiphilales bacterium]